MKLQHLLLFVIIFYSGVTFSQTLGKIYTKSAADSLYGKVIVSSAINISDLNSMISETKNLVMFSILNNQLVLLGDNRIVLSANAVTVSPIDIFAVCSKSKILELLNYGDASQIKFEIRLGHPTITYGMHTLEEIPFCPPICF